MYRILTERKNVETIKRLILDPKFESYGILNVEGCWKGHHEDSITIELASADSWSDKFANDVYEAAREIKELNEAIDLATKTVFNIAAEKEDLYDTIKELEEALDLAKTA